MDNAYDLLEPNEQEAVSAQAYLNLGINPTKVALFEMGALAKELDRIANDRSLVDEALEATKIYTGNVPSLVDKILSERSLGELNRVHGGAKGR